MLISDPSDANDPSRNIDADTNNEEELEVGSWKAIIYEFCHFLDEIFHAINLDKYEIGYRFCQWAHRKEWK